MTPEQFNKLERGDLVRHKSSGDALIVETAGTLVGVRITSLTNPSEWDQVDRGGRVISTDEPEPTYTLDQIADACVDAEISSGHFESLEIALVERRKRYG